MAQTSGVCRGNNTTPQTTHLVQKLEHGEGPHPEARTDVWALGHVHLGHVHLALLRHNEMA